jgi:PAS domain S-box-containing protein
LFDPVLERTGFAITLIGMLLAAWIGGIGPGLMSQTLLLFAQGLLFTAPEDSKPPWTMEGIVSLVSFYAVGGIVGALSEAWQAALNRERAQKNDAISQREQLQTTIGCVADGVLVTDAEGRVTLMNPVAESMTGWPLGEARGKLVRDVFAVFDERSQEIVENPVSRVLREGAILHEATRLFLTTRNDRRLPIALSAAPIQTSNGKITGVVLILRDETERYRREEALRTADRRKDEFLATLAHELRNPLAPICMGLELMEHGVNSNGADEVRAMMERQSNHMVRLIDDLLDVSRITRGKLELRRCPVELSEVVRNAVDAARPTIEDARHRLTVSLPERPVLLYADPNRLTQVVSNLLNNAAKYTPAGGRIELAAGEGTGQVVITVSDSGVGISPDVRESIFDMFTQVRGDLESGHKGLGIGLTLVKRLVELHGGTVDVESDGKNQGSRFRVRLPSMPQSSSPKPSADHATHNPRAATRQRVLVVDDNSDALKTLSMLVKLMGHEVCEAHDGVAAVALAEQYLPDVVLMDIGMPNLNGYDAARQIRDQPWGRDMILIATTGWGQDDDRRRTKDAGFDHHLVKPIDHTKLGELLDGAPRQRLEARPKTEQDIQPSILPRLATAGSTLAGGRESNAGKPLIPVLPR